VSLCAIFGPDFDHTLTFEAGIRQLDQSLECVSA
jgi:hypothetical protein